MRYLFQLFSPLIAKRVMWRKLAYNGKWKDIFSHFYFLLNYIKNIIFLCSVTKWMIIVWDFCSYLFGQLFVTKLFFLLLQKCSTLFPSQFKAVKNLISCGKLKRNICSTELVSFDQLFPRLFIRLDISWSQIHQTFGRLTLPCNAFWQECKHFFIHTTILPLGLLYMPNGWKFDSSFSSNNSEVKNFCCTKYIHTSFLML